MIRGGPATAQAGATCWCFPCNTGLEGGPIGMWKYEGKDRDKMEVPVSDMQEQEVDVSKAPGSEYRHLRQDHVGYNWQGGRWGFPGPSKLTLYYTILLALGLGLAAQFFRVFFFLFPFGMRLLVAIYWKCLTCFSQGLAAKSLSSVPWEIWKSY